MPSSALCHLLFYGSLLHPAETLKHDIEVDRLLPVRLAGLRRVFDHEATRRTGVGAERAVLDVRHAPGGYLNALLARDVDTASLATLDKREVGYERIGVARAALTAWNEADAPLLAALAPLPIFIYYGLEERRRDDIVPIPRYLDLCRAGADHWGAAFRAEFERTTHLARGGTLATGPTAGDSTVRAE